MMEIITCEQGTPEWHQARVGIPTASEFQTLLMKGKKGGESLTRKTYMRKLAGEIITGEPMEGFTNKHIERGHVMEPDARNYYALVTGNTPKLVGFIRNGDKGGSPDSLIGDDGLLEIKTALPHILIEYIEADVFPSEHIAQCQGNLWVSGRQWLDLVVYWPKMPTFIKRIERDPVYIAKLTKGVADFNAELAALVDRVKAYGQ